MKLHFDARLIRRLLEHSISGKKRRPTLDQTFAGIYRKDGRTIDPSDHVGGAAPRLSDIDLSRIPPGLWLVSGRGIYLMSNAMPPLLIADGSAHLVAYASEGRPTIPVTVDGGPRSIIDFLPANLVQTVLRKVENGIACIMRSDKTLQSASPSIRQPPDVSSHGPGLLNVAKASMTMH